MLEIALCTGGLCVLVILLCYSIYKMDRSRIEQFEVNFPGPVSNPIEGNLGVVYNCFNFKDVSHEISRLFDRYGKFFRLWMGTELWICTADPQIVQDVLEDRHVQEEPPIYNFFNYFQDGILFHKKHQRKDSEENLIKIKFHKKTKQVSKESVNKEINSLINNLKGSEFNTSLLQEQLSKCLHNILKDTDWSIETDVPPKKGGLLHNITMMIEYLNVHTIRSIISTQTYLIYKLELRYNLKAKLSEVKPLMFFNTKNSIQHISLMKDEKDESGESESQTVCKELVRQWANQTKNDWVSDLKLTPSDIFLEGLKKTKSVLTHIFYNLAVQPQIQKNLYKELRKAVNNDLKKELYEADLKDMRTLDMVVKEGLRIDGCLGVARKLHKDILSDGKMIPKGAVVFIAVDSLHTEPAFWKEPCSFHPDHFSEESTAQRPKYAFIPFSKGPSHSEDKEYLILLMKLILASTIRSYIIKPSIEPEDLSSRCTFANEVHQHIPSLLFIPRK